MKKFLVLILFLVATTLIALPKLGVAMAASPTNWGLGGYQNNNPPVPPATGSKELKDFGGMYYDASDEAKEQKKIYLTFDLGYEAGYTEQILDVLSKNNIKAVFFLCGNYLQETDLITRMVQDGHLIGNHTYHHKDLPTLSEEQITEDIDKLDEAFKLKYGNMYNKPITMFRPGRGRFDKKTLQIAKSLGKKTVMWSLAVADWGAKPYDVAAASKKIQSRIHPGAVILLHITNESAPKLLEHIIPSLIASGYTFCQLS